MQFYLTWVNEGNVADSNHERDLELVLVVIFRGLAYFFNGLFTGLVKLCFLPVSLNLVTLMAVNSEAVASYQVIADCTSSYSVSSSSKSTSSSGSSSSRSSTSSSTTSSSSSSK